jgi:hypothetical protein
MDVLAILHDKRVAETGPKQAGLTALCVKNDLRAQVSPWLWAVPRIEGRGFPKNVCAKPQYDRVNHE